MVAHAGVPGPASFIAIGLFLVGIGAAAATYWCFNRFGRTPAYGVGAFACGCFVLATIVPLLFGARPSLSRPATTGRLEIVSPRPGEVFEGNPATVPVQLRLSGGRIVPLSSLRLVPNEGHIHLSLDGSLVSMTTGLDTEVTAPPGTHEILAEFVAVDHGPFQPRVVATVTFRVRR